MFIKMDKKEYEFPLVTSFFIKNSEFLPLDITSY